MTATLEKSPLTEERLFTKQLLLDPYPVYRRLQDEAPIYLDPFSRELLITRYGDVAAALKHPALSSARVAKDGLPMPRFVRPLMRPVTRLLSQGMLFSDPPDHTRLRGLVTRAFTPRVVEGMRARIRQVSDELLDALDPSRPVELIEQYAAWLPVIVIAEMLGAPLQHREQFKLWSDDLVLFVGGSTLPRPVVLYRGARGVFGLRRYLAKLVREHRGTGRDDLLSALIAAEQEGDQLTEQELLSNALLLLAAGHETTTNLIGNGMLSLLQNPDQLRLLRSAPERIGAAVDEFLRYESPVQWVGRMATAELEIGGVGVPEGQMVALCLGAANRDPAQFRDPDRLDITRAENRHLAFAHGIHFCLGSALARMEGEIALGSLLQRFPNARLAEAEPVWRQSFALRGLERLRLHLQ